MKAWLIQIDAWAGNDAVSLRMASHDDDRLCHLNGAVWWPVIAKLPTLRYDFFDGSFDAASITSPSGSFSANIEAIPALPAMAIHDSRIRIWLGDLGAAFDGFMLIFDGRVKDQPPVETGTMTISFGADDGWLDQPLLATYAGTGAGEGGEELKGQVKPLALGAPRYAPATLIDAVDHIYQLSAYGPIVDVDAAFERLNRFSAPIGNVSSFAAIKAVDVQRGQWLTCRAQGLVRFGAPPDGMLCFHLGGDAVGGWSRLPGDIIARIATIGGGAGRYATGDVAALNVARPWPLSIVVTAQTTARDLIQRIAMSVNAVAYVDWLGVLRIAALSIGAPSMTIASDGSALPPVADIEQISIAVPYWKMAQGAATTWQVHAFSDIAFSAPLNPRGPYDPAEAYREGDMVTLPNGSQWLFIGTTPATGSTPHDINPNWFRLSDAITAANITYGSGETVEYFKPRQPGADVTGDNTANDVSNVGGRPVEQVIDDLDLNGANWLSMASLEATRDALMLARTSLDGVPVGTVIANFKTEQQTENSATAENFALLGAKAGDGNSWLLDQSTVRVGPVDGGSGPTQSMGQRFQSINTALGDASGAINDLRSVVIDASGGVTAKAVLGITVDSGGRKLVSGMVMTNDGTLASLDLLFTAYNFLTPSGESIFSYSDPGSGGDGKVHMNDIVVRTIEARAVKTDTIDANSVTGLTSYGFPDAYVNGVVTIAEITDLVIGDGADGRAQVIVNFMQDGTTNIDTAMRIITSVDLGSGYFVMRDHIQGIGVSSGNARWIFPASYSIPILANGPVKFKVTAQPYSLPGVGTLGASYARKIQIDIFEGFR